MKRQASAVRGTKNELLAPKIKNDWRDDHPPGSIVRIAEYETERGWYWKNYRVLAYFPHVVLCEDRMGFKRGFGNWEFQRRQTGQVSGISGRPVPLDIRQKIGDG